ncbi:MAG: flavodoxin family protein [Candidatus Thorarchaeota archaeon]
MENKILAINCSPRKGNNYTLLETIPNDKAEIVNLYDYDIKSCEGCGLCKDLKKCKIDDQFMELIEKIKHFDRVIFATPVYRLNMPSRVYAFIERTSALLLNNENFEGKICGIVCIGRITGNGKIQVLNTLTDFLFSMGCIVLSPIVIGNAHKIGEIKNDPIAELSFKGLVERLLNIKISFNKK